MDVDLSIQQHILDQLRTNAKNCLNIMIDHDEDHPAPFPVFRSHLARNTHILPMLYSLTGESAAIPPQAFTELKRFIIDIHNNMKVIQNESRFDSKIARLERRAPGIKLKLCVQYLYQIYDLLLRYKCYILLEAIYYSSDILENVNEAMSNGGDDPFADFDDFYKSRELQSTVQQNREGFELLKSSAVVSLVMRFLGIIAKQGLSRKMDLSPLQNMINRAKLRYGEYHEPFLIIDSTGHIESLEHEVAYITNLCSEYQKLPV